MSVIAIRRNQFGRTPTRGKSNARPLSSGMEISNFTRRAGHWFSPSLCDLVARTVARVRDRSGVGARNHGRSVPLQFIWALSVPRTVFSGLHRAPALFQSSARAVAYVFQALSSPSCVFDHAFKEQHGAFRWKEKAFPNSTKVLAKVK